MANDTVSSDLAIGIGALLAVVAVLSAVGMATVDPTATTESGMHLTAVPFALAMIVGVIAVTSIHLFWDE